MGKMTKRSMAAVAAAVVAVSGAGAAYAAWVFNSQAEVNVKAGKATPVSVKTVNVVGLVPGGTGDLVVKLANPNKFRVQLKSLTGPTVQVADAPAGCTSSSHGITIAHALPQGIVLPAEMGEKEFTIPKVVSMSNDSHTDCQEANFRFTFQVVGESTNLAATPGL